VAGEPVIIGGAGLSEKMGSIDDEEHPVKIKPANRSPHKKNPKFDTFQNNFIVINPYETGCTINTFV
jgi:hypothetical protein